MKQLTSNYFLKTLFLALSMFWCIRCLHKWTRKLGHDKHFDLPKIAKTHGGTLSDNPCYKLSYTNPSTSLSKAKMLRRQAKFPLTNLFKKKPKCETSITKDTPSPNKDEYPSDIENVVLEKI